MTHLLKHLLIVSELNPTAIYNNFCFNVMLMYIVSELNPTAIYNPNPVIVGANLIVSELNPTAIYNALATIPMRL